MSSDPDMAPNVQEATQPVEQPQQRVQVTISPPPYLESEHSNTFTAAGDAFWEDKLPEDWLSILSSGSQIPLLKHTRLEFQFNERCPAWVKDLDKNERSSLPLPSWQAILSITPRCIPRLMRQGFHWSSANVIKERTFVQLHDAHLGTQQYNSGWRHTKHYFLQDLGDEPQWIASLVVYFSREETISDFRLEKIVIDNISWVRGWNWADRLVYAYNAFTDVNYNAIYDDMPLDGWWPWPKKSLLDWGHHLLVMPQGICSWQLTVVERAIALALQSARI